MNDEAGNKIVEGLHKLWETSLLQNVKANPEWATGEIQNQYAIRMKYEIEIGELKEKNKKLKTKNKNLQSKIDKAIEYINKHCVNEKISKEVGYKCYTMADTNELEKIMNILGDDK